MLHDWETVTTRLGGVGRARQELQFFRCRACRKESPPLHEMTCSTLEELRGLPTCPGNPANAPIVKIIEASMGEWGLLINGQGARTWWKSSFPDGKPTVDHPLVKEAIEAHATAIPGLLEPPR